MNRSPYDLFIFVLLGSLVSSSFSLYHDNIPCTPVGVCKCKFYNGLGVDLNLLRGYNFSMPLSKGTVIFYPCKNVEIQNRTINVTLNECKTGVSLCLETDEAYYSLGSVSESSFLWRRINDNPVLVFSNNKTTSNVFLECDQDATDHKVQYDKESSKDNIYNFRLISNLACVGSVEVEGHSVFSTFLIIVLVIFLLYFFGGFCVLRFIRGARGWEAIPNGEFWKSAILGTKKMFIYLINGCKHPDPYDTI